MPGRETQGEIARSYNVSRWVISEAQRVTGHLVIETSAYASERNKVLDEGAHSETEGQGQRARALPDQIESSGRKGSAQIQGVGACSDRKSRSTFSEHARKSASLQM